MEFKALVSIIVIILSLVGYIPYIIDIFKNKTKPHAFTWFIAFVTASIAFALQVEGGAGVGSIPMAVIAAVVLVVLVLSIWKGTRDITKSDVVFLVLSLIALVLWLFAGQPVVSVVLITVCEVLSFIPTVRKSWKAPYTETLSLYSVSMFRHSLAIVALEKINILTALYPAAWALSNVVITVILILRRRKIPNIKSEKN